MAGPRPLLPSLLDRLFDDNPGVTRDAVPARAQDQAWQVLREVKKALRRDLEALLNSRVRNVVWGPHLKQLDNSLLNYGLPDFAVVNLVSQRDREAFCRQLEEIITTHEPRLLAVRVEPTTDSIPIDRTFRFRIHAKLRKDPAPEPVTFDSVLRPATANFQIDGDGA